MGTDLVYVSGRKRKPGEMNGKSCNLNNCLSQIYPEGVPIPTNELVCIFDADQVKLQSKREQSGWNVSIDSLLLFGLKAYCWLLALSCLQVYSMQNIQNSF